MYFSRQPPAPNVGKSCGRRAFLSASCDKLLMLTLTQTLQSGDCRLRIYDVPKHPGIERLISICLHHNNFHVSMSTSFCGWITWLMPLFRVLRRPSTYSRTASEGPPMVFNIVDRIRSSVVPSTVWWTGILNNFAPEKSVSILIRTFFQRASKQANSAN